MKTGTLFLVPVPLAAEATAKSFTPFSLETINVITCYIVENEKTARRFLKEAGLRTPQSELLIHDYGKHQRNGSLKPYFAELLKGQDVGLMSEAGCPGIADPGADIVAEAHRLGIRVVPLPGPNSIILALMGSGFNGQSFVFHGYLPIDKEQRARRLRELEASARKNKQTQIFIETPFRNNQLVEEILRSCRPDTRLCIGCDLTGTQELIQTQTVQKWQKSTPDLHKRPAIFLLA